MKNTKVIVTLIICTTVVLLSGIGAAVFVNISNQNKITVQNEQARKDKIFSECMERTKTETVGMGTTWVNKDGDSKYCKEQTEK